MKEIRLYNTLSREKELFVPMEEHSHEVRIYSCGPTVYHYAHIGNLRAYVIADILRRMFVASGYSVKHVINITDVGHLVSDGDLGEDKLEKGAAREGKSVWDIAKFYTDAYFDDLKLLNIDKEAYIFPRATETIPEQIELIQNLEQKGFTYIISDGVYFDTSKFSHYTDLAKLDIEGLKSGARVEENKEKRNITDFALWKFSPKDSARQMEWDSPWGKGFPGWHIECSAMSKKLLGPHFDIHTGGIDHIPVHHTNEIAQSECASGEKYVNYWMHVNFLNDKSGKMSKSNDDFLRLKTLIDKGYNPLAYRYFLLTAHYRSEINFSFEALDAAQTAYKKLVDEVLILSKTPSGTASEIYMTKFSEAICDDLSTPSAIAIIWALLKDNAVSLGDKYQTVLAFDAYLGLGLDKLKEEKFEIPNEVQVLMEERKNAREAKDFAKSDELRDKIKELGFDVLDSSGGQELRQELRKV